MFGGTCEPNDVASFVYMCIAVADDKKYMI